MVVALLWIILIATVQSNIYCMNTDDPRLVASFSESDSDCQLPDVVEVLRELNMSQELPSIDLSISAGSTTENSPIIEHLNNPINGLHSVLQTNDMQAAIQLYAQCTDDYKEEAECELVTHVMSHLSDHKWLNMLHVYRLINTPTKCGDTLLHIACAQSNHPAVEALIKRGADIHVLNSTGQNTLTIAQQALEATVKLLQTQTNILTLCASQYANPPRKMRF